MSEQTLFNNINDASISSVSPIHQGGGGIGPAFIIESSAFNGKEITRIQIKFNAATGFAGGTVRAWIATGLNPNNSTNLKNVTVTSKT